MSFPTAAYLRRATGRAKSDVANKLVSMFLHDLSRRICAFTNLSVTDSAYTNAVAAEFGSQCCYCSVDLEPDRAAVEHLDGMNRFRRGLHIPGNVIIACKRCNAEKRRDDQSIHLTLSDSGWGAFLSHDSTRCEAACKTCLYWRDVWPDAVLRSRNLGIASQRIAAFRNRYPLALHWSEKARTALGSTTEKLYRECQQFAMNEIATAAENAFSSLRAATVNVDDQKVHSP